ncbi:MAG: hypothetical protein M3349_02720 [Actinomycetota bacterium]|nr:hypothetical protein [Actinomycetota bacterium]
MTVAMAAGVASTVIFTVSTLPMVLKACRTRDLGSYSLAALVLATMGNLVHSVYIFNLPMGPLWALHGMHLVTTPLMLVLFLRHGRPHPPEPECPTEPHSG